MRSLNFWGQPLEAPGPFACPGALWFMLVVILSLPSLGYAFVQSLPRENSFQMQHLTEKHTQTVKSSITWLKKTPPEIHHLAMPFVPFVASCY